ncbi:MAG: hypothetical protein HKL90_01685 [Elusimicrobia bacterium]|nr:hypothetical protein [Elusimicrobiota bacterium]
MNALRNGLGALVAASGLIAAPAFASSVRPAPIDIRVDRRPGGVFEVSARLAVPASTSAAWSVITDYANIPSFVSSMKSSRVVGRDGGALIVQQTAVGRMFFISTEMRVMLAVRRAGDRLTFDDLDHEDFEVYSGSWRVVAGRGGCEVRYRLLARPDVPAPRFLLGGAMKRGARHLLEQVRDEIMRRELARAAGTADPAHIQRPRPEPALLE